MAPAPEHLLHTDWVRVQLHEPDRDVPRRLDRHQRAGDAARVDRRQPGRSIRRRHRRERGEKN